MLTQLCISMYYYLSRLVRARVPGVERPLPAGAPPRLLPPVHHTQPGLQHPHPPAPVVRHAGHLHRRLPALLATPPFHLARPRSPGPALRPLYAALLVPQPEHQEHDRQEQGQYEQGRGCCLYLTLRLYAY